jgi:hypothetical protein
MVANKKAERKCGRCFLHNESAHHGGMCSECDPNSVYAHHYFREEDDFLAAWAKIGQIPDVD